MGPETVQAATIAAWLSAFFEKAFVSRVNRRLVGFRPLGVSDAHAQAARGVGKRRAHRQRPSTWRNRLFGAEAATGQAASGGSCRVSGATGGAVNAQPAAAVAPTTLPGRLRREATGTLPGPVPRQYRRRCRLRHSGDDGVGPDDPAADALFHQLRPCLALGVAQGGVIVQRASLQCVGRFQQIGPAILMRGGGKAAISRSQPNATRE